jgi:hypothetical protein
MTRFALEALRPFVAKAILSAPLENPSGALPKNHYNPISIASQPAP